MIPAELELACFGFLSKKITDNRARVRVIIVAGNQWTKKNIDNTKRSCGIIHADIDFIYNFDFSAVTQDNVNALRAVIESTNPSLVIIPNIRTRSQAKRVTCQSSLLAARSVGNVIMYDVHSGKFSPNIVFQLDNKTIEIKKKCLGCYGTPIEASIRTHNRERSISNYSRFSKRSKEIGRYSEEAFQSHRILVDDELWFH